MVERKNVAGGEQDSPGAHATRVLIVDDHELLRRGIRQMVDSEPDLEVCGEAVDEAEAMDQVRATHPHLAIVDIGLKTGSGLDLIKRIKAHDPRVRIIVSSMHEERLYGERALRAGAEGYINKQESARAVVQAIRHVLAGKLYFSDQLTDRVLRRAREGGTSLAASPIDSLSDRELEVFRLIGQGLASGEIAKKLHVSPSTVDTYRERLKTKLSLKRGLDLVHTATQWVLENP